MNNINNLFFEGQCKRETSDPRSPEHLYSSTMSEESQARLSSAECSLNSIFYQLIRVAIGTRICLSHTPSADEWGELYSMAKKQSLVGVCFAGVQKLVNQQQELPKMLYLTWMGMAAKIQQRNEIVTKQSSELQAKIAKAGFKSSILKGQAVAKYYGSLVGLRQSGDIDVLLWPVDGEGRLIDSSLSSRRKEIIKYARSLCPGAKAFYHHVDVDVFQDTEVEMHYTPSWFHSPLSNSRFQKWVESNKERLFHENDGLALPSVEINLVYILEHCYQHLFQEGIGLRQIVDYYFVLKASNKQQREEVFKVIKSLGMGRFARGIMNIMLTVLGLTEEELLCEADPEEGAFLLSEIMQAGNFGKHDERIKRNGNNSEGALFMKHVKRNLHFLKHYPSEVVWSPYFKLKHGVMRKTILR